MGRERKPTGGFPIVGCVACVDCGDHWHMAEIIAEVSPGCYAVQYEMPEGFPSDLRPPFRIVSIDQMEANDWQFFETHDEVLRYAEWRDRAPDGDKPGPKIVPIKGLH
jgi:hypothetical protein